MWPRLLMRPLTIGNDLWSAVIALMMLIVDCGKFSSCRIDISLCLLTIAYAFEKSVKMTVFCDCSDCWMCLIGIAIERPLTKPNCVGPDSRSR